MIQSREATVSSGDGTLSFVLRLDGGAVQVVREQCVEGVGKLTLVLQFSSPVEFECFLDADPLRLRYPGTFVSVSRTVSSYLAGLD
jgi:hypothetical protein